MGRKKSRTAYPITQFRPGKALEEALCLVADAWQTSTHEVARRVVLLAFVGLLPEHHDLIQELAALQGNADDFASATMSYLVQEILVKPDLDYPVRKPRKNDPAVTQLQEMIEKLKAVRKRSD